MASICITGSTDGIGLSAARQLAEDGHEVIVHARSAERGKPVAAELGARLVVADLADLDQVRELAGAVGPVDVLVHNAGVWPRGIPDSAQGYEPAFAVNVLAPHLLTALLGPGIRQRLVFLGSGMVSSGRVDPDRLGAARDGARAYADSKAIDVALALGWARRRPDLLVAAVDPGWVKTKLASAGAPGDVESGGARVRAGRWGSTARRGRARRRSRGRCPTRPGRSPGTGSSGSRRGS
jgi:NAD(P)-dependent dehydrogenase (short-subunit alcohol dehydrogenase family)